MIARKSRRIQSHRRSVLGSLAFLCVGLGCRIDDQIDRRSITDLYREAMVIQTLRSAQAEAIVEDRSIDGPYTVPPEEFFQPADGFGEEGVFAGSIPDFVGGLPKISNPNDSGTDAPGDHAKISEVFDQTDIRDALQMLAAYTDVSVVIDDSIGGLVTARIDGESFDVALQKILLPLGLEYVKRGKEYIIAPPDPNSPLFYKIAHRTTFRPAHHNIQSLTEILPRRLQQFVETSAERNLAVIEAPMRLSDEIIARLAELDQPIPQVELEAIVCVASPDSSFRFGLDWGHVVGVDDIQSLRIGMTGLATAGSISGHGIKNIFSDFAVTSAFMRLLAQEGYVTIRAAPRVTTKDGQKAQISLNRETFFNLQPDASNVFFRQDVQKVEAGISLEIIPRVHGDMVAVEIAKAEVSEDIRNGDAGSSPGGNGFPIINRRVVSTSVQVRDGHTIVIGGLVQRQTVDRISRVPGISSIPKLGKLFQIVEKVEQDVEVAIFISPRIVAEVEGSIVK